MLYGWVYPNLMMVSPNPFPSHRIVNHSSSHLSHYVYFSELLNAYLFALFYFTLLYTTPLYTTLLYSTLLYSTLLYSTLLFFT